MSYNNALHIPAQGRAGVRHLVDYLCYGSNEKKRMHVEQGANRIAYMSCDHPGGIEGFVDEAENLPRRFRRKNGAHSIVQSFPASDGMDASDAERVNRMGYRLAKRVAPGADCLVITHVDADHIHNHILVMNHDRTSGKAVDGCGVKRVRKLNNDIMREESLEVLGEVKLAWPEKRRDITDERVRYLGDSIHACMQQASDMDEFERMLGECEYPIRIKRKHVEGKEHPGLKYETQFGVDTDRRPNSWRGRTASNICADFTAERLSAYFEQKQAVKPMQASIEPEWDEESTAEAPQPPTETRTVPEPAAVPTGAPAAHQQAPAPLVEVPETPDTQEIEENLEELFRQSRARNTVGSGGKYVALNREMERLLSERGRDGLARLRDEWQVQVEATVDEIERQKRNQRELSKRTTAENICGAASDKLMHAAQRDGDLFALVLALLFKMEEERLRQKRLREKLKAEEKLKKLRPAKWNEENRVNAATRTIDRFDSWADAREERMAERREQAREAKRTRAGEQWRDPTVDAGVAGIIASAGLGD